MNFRAFFQSRHSKRSIIRGTLKIAAVFFAFLIMISLFTYSFYKKILTEELTANNEINTQSFSRQMDDFFKSMVRITSTLSINSMVRFYISPSEEEAAEIFNGLYERIHEQLLTYTLAFDYIDSIYVYAPQNQTVIRSSVVTSHSTSFLEPVSTFQDDSWIPMLQQMESNLYCAPRSINGIYPYVLTIIQRFPVDDEFGYIILNLNIEKMPVPLETAGAGLSEAYILTDNGEVLYRRGKRALLEERAQFPELSLFDGTKAHVSSIMEGREPFIYTQIQSVSYSWHYITITYLQEYSSRLNQLRSMLILIFSVLFLCSAGFSLLLSMDQYRPIRRLLFLLENPKTLISNERQSNEDVRRIAEHITSYIQKNTELSSELKRQMDVLNDTRIWALQAQINPHFIFNTLNQIHLETVRNLGYSNKVSHMIVSFGKIMRYALEAENLVPLSREAEYANLFIDLLSERYENRIRSDIQLDPTAADAAVPHLLLQPLIENAVQHGMEGDLKRQLQILIQVEPQPDGNTILIRVKDNGVGIEPDQLRELQKSLEDYTCQAGKHIGLKNIATRLHLLFPGQSSIELSSVKGSGTVITLRIPFQKSSD